MKHLLIILFIALALISAACTPKPTAPVSQAPVAQSETIVTRCNAVTKSGKPCQNRVKPGTKCHLHQGATSGK